MPTLKLPPEVATILAMVTGLLGAVLTTFGAAPADANAAVTALQYILSAIVLIAGLVGHLHVHGQNVTAQNVTMASFASIPPPPASNAPVSPSYLTTVAPGITVALPMSTPSPSNGTPNTMNVPTMTITPLIPADPSTVTLNPTVSNLPPPAADTPTLTVPKVSDTTTVSAT